jgi:predicted DsbA family dithiol-disulfide isomerase
MDADPLLEPRTVLHWYDFICPFCYVGQHRNAILTGHGLDVKEMPFQAHPDFPAEGVAAGPRTGPMYAMLEREAEKAGLALLWPTRLPNSRRALAAAEWVRHHEPEKFPRFHRDLFAAHFALGENLGDPLVIDRHAAEAGIDRESLNAALSDGRADRNVARAEVLGRAFGVEGTPAWLIQSQLVSGLRSAAEFESLAEAAIRR